MEIATIKTLPPGTPVDSVVGTIRKISKVRSGTGKFGPFTFQSVSIVDAAGDDLAIELGNQHEVTAQHVGLPLIVTAGWDDKKGKSKGCEIEVKTWTNEKGEECEDFHVKVNKSASIVIGNTRVDPARTTPKPSSQAPSTPPANEPEPEASEHQSEASDAPTSQPGPTAPDPKEGLRACVRAAKRAAQIGSAYQIAFSRVMEIRRWASEKYGQEIPLETLTAWATGIVIELNRSTITSALPTDKPASEYLRSLMIAPPPAPTRIVDVSSGKPAMPATDEDDSLPF